MKPVATGPDHYREAERILQGVADFEAEAPQFAPPDVFETRREYVRIELDKAKVHTMLAQVAATAQAAIDRMGQDEFQAWDEVCGVPS